jgi:hypothetical protein
MVMKETKVKFYLIIFLEFSFLISCSQNGYSRQYDKGDIILIDSLAWFTFPDSVLFQIDFRQFSKENFYEDSLNYEFRFLSLDICRKNKIKARVLHKPIKNEDNPSRRFIAYYQVNLNRVKNIYKIKRVKRLLTEL